MKNIHLLPTDKPSRLAGSEYITNEQGIDKRVLKFKLWDKLIPNKDLKDIGYIPQHIYITSDEEIKQGDWVLSLTDDESYLEVYKYEGTTYLGEDKKIILTTDPDLIKEGIAVIDDEFLEWFVKNPSCESVEFNAYPIGPNGNIIGTDRPYPFDGLISNFRIEYKIIIPQEETLEEVAERLAKEHCNIRVNPNTTEFQIQQFIIKGAVWQAQRMYSEEEVLELLPKFAAYTLINADEENRLSLKEWFEQFKKK
jgi:hypothetical protein